MDSGLILHSKNGKQNTLALRDQNIFIKTLATSLRIGIITPLAMSKSSSNETLKRDLTVAERSGREKL